MKVSDYLKIVVCFLILLAGPAKVRAAASNEELEKKLDILTEELQNLKMDLMVPKDAEAAKKYKSQYGFGPAASKVYGVTKGLSIGGYAEAMYQSLIKDKGDKENKTDFYRYVLYTGYKFSDKILFNTEFEVEHASTGKSGSVSLEFAYLDFFLSQYANARVGMMLIPMGFISEMHEPTTYHGNARPEVEQKIIPTTWRANGVGIFGTILPGLVYRVYGVNSMDGTGFSSSGIRSGRQKASKALAEDLAITGRVDYTPTPGVLIGVSGYSGEVDHNQSMFNESVKLNLGDVHMQVHLYGVELRALGAWGNISGTDAYQSDAYTEYYEDKHDGKSPPVVGKHQRGWYVEGAYDILPLIFPDTIHYLAPFIRYEQYNAQAGVTKNTDRDKSQENEVLTTGLTYKPHPQVVLKLDYKYTNILGKARVDKETGDFIAEDRADEINFGAGFMF